MALDRHAYCNSNVGAAAVLDQCANKDAIYRWMDVHGIGESQYGAFLDAMAKGKGVFYHRLYGHHPIYDFPWTDLDNIPDFMEHVLISDAFTRQGLPILPGDFLNNPAVKEYCNLLSSRWNFVNAFDVLTGTAAIYAGYKNLSKYMDGQQSIETLTQLAEELGVGVIELAIAFSKANPLLLFGAALHLAGTLRGVLNDSATIFFNKLNGVCYLQVAPMHLDIAKANAGCYLVTTDCGKALAAENDGCHLRS